MPYPVHDGVLLVALGKTGRTLLARQATSSPDAGTAGFYVIVEVFWCARRAFMRMSAWLWNFCERVIVVIVSFVSGQCCVSTDPIPPWFAVQILAHKWRRMRRMRGM